jgi:hypothetical protein
MIKGENNSENGFTAIFTPSKIMFVLIYVASYCRFVYITCNLREGNTG